MLHTASLTVALFTFWYLLSGHNELMLLILGVLSCLIVVWIALRMDVIDHESHPIHLSARLPGYWLWLLWEIVKANFTVARIVWSPRPPISPRVIRVTPSQQTDLGRVIYANSITLTPGTVSIHVEHTHIDVHALTATLAEDLAHGIMDRRVTRLERHAS